MTADKPIRWQLTASANKPESCKAEVKVFAEISGRLEVRADEFKASKKANRIE